MAQIFTMRLRCFGLAGSAVLLFGSSALGATNSLTELREQFEVIAKTVDGKVGAAVELLETKEAVSLNGQEHFPMQSVYKLPIAMAVLHEVDQGEMTLEQRSNSLEMIWYPNSNTARFVTRIPRVAN